MAMTAKLHSLNSLAVELGRDRRTIARALRHVRPDGESGGHRAWFLATAIAALERIEGRRGDTGDGHDENNLGAIEDASQRVQSLLDDLRALPDVAARRRLMRSGAGAVIGKLVDAFDRVESCRDANARMITKPFIDKILGETIGEVMHLCEWTLAAAAGQNNGRPAS